MRPLEEQELQQVFEKLHKYIGKNVKQLIERQVAPNKGVASAGGPSGFCFRLQKQRVFYVSEALVRRATCIGREQLISLGSCIGKFTKSGKFRLTITGLDVLAGQARHKVWLKPSSEMSFLYGNHVLKSGLARITEGTDQYQGVIVYSMSDIPLGFGVAAKSTQDCRKLDPNAIVVFHQADVGEYLRMEDDL